MRGLLLALPLLAGSASAEVAITMAPTGHALVPVAVAGHGTVPLVFDTGAEGSAIYASVAEAWTLPRKKSGEQLVGQTGSVQVPLVTLPQLTLDGVGVSGIEAAVLPARGDGQALNGIVGLDLFGDKVLDFDLPRHRMALLDSAKVLAAGQLAVVAERLRGSLLAVPVFAGGITARAVIDTGARKTRVNGKFAQALGLSAGPGEVIRGATNAPVATLAAVVPAVRVGGVTLTDAPVLVADLPVFADFGVDGGPAVILGLDWLERMRMVIDFPADRVWFMAPEEA
jgi:predicted aspartyl protease